MIMYKNLMNKALVRRNLLASYIGRDYNEKIKSDIENAFNPYKLYLCDIDYFYLEICLINIIRCVVDNGKITQLSFN